MVDAETLFEALLKMSLRSASFTNEAVFWYKAKLLFLGLLSSSARLSGFLDHKTLDNVAALAEYIFNPFHMSSLLVHLICSIFDTA